MSQPIPHIFLIIYLIISHMLWSPWLLDYREYVTMTLETMTSPPNGWRQEMMKLMMTTTTMIPYSICHTSTDFPLPHHILSLTLKPLTYHNLPYINWPTRILRYLAYTIWILHYLVISYISLTDLPYLHYVFTLPCLPYLRYTTWTCPTLLLTGLPCVRCVTLINISCVSLAGLPYLQYVTLPPFLYLTYHSPLPYLVHQWPPYPIRYLTPTILFCLQHIPDFLYYPPTPNHVSIEDAAV